MYIHRVAGISPGRPIFPDNSLSIVERVFHKVPIEKPQVIMGMGIELSSVYPVSTDKLLQVLTAAASMHHRCCSYVDVNTQTTHLLAKDAQGFVFPCRHYTTATFEEMFANELNTPFDVQDMKKPLCRASLLQVDPKRILIVISFHHCIGDGLSMLAFSKTFLSLCTFENLSGELDLTKFPCQQEPPPLLDNIINPNVLSVLSTAMTVGMNEFYKSKVGKFQKLFDKTDGKGSNLKFLRFTKDVVDALRLTSRKNGTTMAAVLVVVSLVAARGAFKSNAESSGIKLPKHQGWVVTSSMRHLIPGSKLMEGGDKQSDPALQLFGGYGSSISDHKLKLDDRSRFWERCRTVKRRITNDFFGSMRRMKLLNWVYRHPKIWNFIQKKTDLAKMSKSYSVEVANLGAWDYPCAPPDASEDDLRLRANRFQGALSSHFEGVRGVFCLGVLTLGTDMSVSVSYDTSAVSETTANEFIKVFKHCLAIVCQSDKKLRVADILSQTSISE